MGVERPPVDREPGLGQRDPDPFAEGRQRLQITEQTGPEHRAEPPAAGQVQTHRAGPGNRGQSLDDRLLRHVAEERQGDMPLVRTAGGMRRQVTAQMVAGLLGREDGDEEARAGQDDSRAAGPPPNNTSSQLGRRLRGLLLSSDSVLADVL
ncbi:hypothetical protein GCM10010112_36960 [Actinoplanes lobatus]|uniref:Uncharacterized protein n=1 Tax=Actinoplanes lobatus TaxID=113568 RepID=A0ABQ4AGK3_9ACTN|nr:hypothetical protein GCM10010112_36960 [Actinoplanes lobatus]GIE40108.1 hypothetical protein Alo02nite_30060 [Actinoplanes lobatus]